MESSDALRIVIASSEAAPFSKSGGLADVTPALCRALAARGHDVTLIIPYHRQTPAVQAGLASDIHETGVRFSVPVGSRVLTATLYWSVIPGSTTRVLLIGQPYFFDRPGLYQENGHDYHDNCDRFVFFSRAVVDCCRKLVLRPDIIHVNDWQTSLIPALLETESRDLPEFRSTASVLTIHNLAFQGAFDQSLMPLTGMDWRFFNWRQMEAHGHLNLLKAGIAFANKLTTVSPTYAQEIQGAEAGCRLDSALRSRTNDLTGVLNGIDHHTWNPATDEHIAENYDVESVSQGKLKCRNALQSRVGLPQRNDVPLFGIISRMTDQKGFDLIADRADEMLKRDMQLVVLGTGEQRYESLFRDLAAKYPDKVAAWIGFDESLAHQIEAGCDVFLMPSRFEPCGLNQMYSLAYGTVPLVRAVGGLADSVVDTNSETIADGSATGIVFADYDSVAFFAAFDRAFQLCQDQETHMKVVRNGMQQDTSWSHSAQEYVSIYHRAMEAVCSRNSAIVASANSQFSEAKS